MKAAVAALFVLTLAACSQAPEGTSISSTAARATGASTGEIVAPASSTAAPLPATTATAPTADATTMLTQYHWQLADAVAKSSARIDALLARTTQSVQLDFDAHSVSISNTCNHMHGSYSAAGSKLTIGNLASTMMACHDPALTALDTAVGKLLQGPFEPGLDSHGKQPQLMLTTANGSRLTFVGVPTTDTRYGGTGATMFLEVAPQTKPCHHPLGPNAQCLEVRELHNGANGVTQGKPGGWYLLDQGIEGYTHQSGTHTVLRVKRYRIANPPADASSAAYVLDMEVETGLPPHAS